MNKEMIELRKENQDLKESSNELLEINPDFFIRTNGTCIEKIIVEKNMKGNLKVENTNKGAKFSIHIPKSSF